MEKRRSRGGNGRGLGLEGALSEECGKFPAYCIKYGEDLLRVDWRGSLLYKKDIQSKDVCLTVALVFGTSLYLTE